MVGVLSFFFPPLPCEVLSPFKLPLLPQVKTETDREGGKEEEALLAEEHRPSTPSLPLLRLLRCGLLFTRAANQSHPHPAPTTQPLNEPWTWTTSRPQLSRRASGKPAEAPETCGALRARIWTGSGRAWPWSFAAVAAG